MNRQGGVLVILVFGSDRPESPGRGGYADHRNGQPERFYGYYPGCFPAGYHPDLRGSPDPQLVSLCGMEGYEEVHG